MTSPTGRCPKCGAPWDQHVWSRGQPAVCPAPPREPPSFPDPDTDPWRGTQHLADWPHEHAGPEYWLTLYGLQYGDIRKRKRIHERRDR